MNNTISIHQPNYIPWIGYFYKIYKSDIFIFHDDVQFSKKGMHNFHYIKTSEGPFRLKIPVIQSNGDLILTVVTKDELDWKKSHLKKIKENYSGAKYFEVIYNDFEELLLQDYTSMANMNIQIIKGICNKLKIKSEFILASDLTLISSKEQKVIDLVKAVNGKIYYSGIGAKDYQNENTFIENDLKLIYSDYEAFQYPQFFDPFQSNVTILDYLMHCGYDWERVLKNQQNSNE